VLVKYTRHKFILASCTAKCDMQHTSTWQGCVNRAQCLIVSSVYFLSLQVSLSELVFQCFIASVCSNCKKDTWNKWRCYFKLLLQILVLPLWALFSGYTFLPTSGFKISYVVPPPCLDYQGFDLQMLVSSVDLSGRIFSQVNCMPCSHVTSGCFWVESK